MKSEEKQEKKVKTHLLERKVSIIITATATAT